MGVEEEEAADNTEKEESVNEGKEEGLDLPGEEKDWRNY